MLVGQRRGERSRAGWIESHWPRAASEVPRHVELPKCLGSCLYPTVEYSGFHFLALADMEARTSLSIDGDMILGTCT